MINIMYYKIAINTGSIIKIIKNYPKFREEFYRKDSLVIKFLIYLLIRFIDLFFQIFSVKPNAPYAS
jgi:hypothetical protein